MMRETRCLVLLAVVLALTPSLSSAYPFLTKSKILRDLGIQILVGENQADAIVFDKAVLKKYGVPADGTDTYLIARKGLRSLRGRASKMNLLKMCAPPYPGVGFNKGNDEGFLIATGKGLEGVIRWYPAETVRYEKSDCFSNLNADDVEFSSYRSEILGGHIHQARWIRALTRTEIDENCRSSADRNAEMNQQTPVDDSYYKNCLSGGWTCRDEGRLIVIFDSKAGECREITNSSIECYGRAGKGEDLRDFLGVVVLRKDSVQETWLIWNAPGYEGDGVYAIEVKDLGKEDTQSAEWRVYNGC